MTNHNTAPTNPVETEVIPTQEFNITQAVAKGVDAIDTTDALPVTPETAPADPWANYGSLGTGPTGALPAWETPLATPEAPAPAEPKKDEPNAYDIARAERRAIKKAEFGVSINGAAIKNILVDNPDLLPPEPEWLTKMNAQKGTDEQADRRADLQATLDAISQLPEKLQFDPGLSLIVGENGLGKSTLLQALKLVAKIREDFNSPHYRDSLKGITFEEYKKEELNPKNLEIKIGGSSDTMPSMLAVKIAEQIDVDAFVNSADLFYLDATTLNGHRNNFGIMAGTREIESDLSQGYSHGQLIKWGIFGHLKNRKEQFEAEKHPSDIGVGVVFMDEIENGLSPKNHRKLKQSVNEVLIEGSIALAATNSEVLYFDPTLPRIDLEHPELGIHLPSEHPEVYDLSEFRV